MRAARNLVVLAVVAFLIFLIGGGIGWFDGDQETRQPNGGDPRKADVGELPDQPKSRPATRTNQNPEAAPTKTAKPEEVDRFLGVLFNVREAVAQGSLGRAWSLIGANRTVPAELRAEWQAARQSCEAALGDAVRALQKEIRRGHILRARQALGKLVDPHTAQVDDALRVLCSEQGWPSFSGALDHLHKVLSVTSEPASKGRRVRVRQQDQWLDATVVQGKGDHWTLRVQNDQGVRFPVVDRLELEFVEPSKDDGIAQASLAAARKETQLARLWLCYALSRADGADLRKQVAPGK